MAVSSACKCCGVMQHYIANFQLSRKIRNSPAKLSLRLEPPIRLYPLDGRRRDSPKHQEENVPEDSGAESSDEVGCDGCTGEVSLLYPVHHPYVHAQEAGIADA